MKMKPTKVNIFGVDYEITYMDNPSNVDIYKRESCWGQIDYWTRTIRIYDKDRSESDVWGSIWHEVIHGISAGLHLDVLEKEENHSTLDLLALAISDVLFRNGWMKVD
jgi:hypothetical protein